MRRRHNRDKAPALKGRCKVAWPLRGPGRGPLCTPVKGHLIRRVTFCPPVLIAPRASGVGQASFKVYCTLWPVGFHENAVLKVGADLRMAIRPNRVYHRDGGRFPHSPFRAAIFICDGELEKFMGTFMKKMWFWRDELHEAGKKKGIYRW